MSKPYDATLKKLVDLFAADWAAFLCAHLGLPAGTRAEPLDPDLSTVSPQADKAFRLTGAAQGLIHLELQASWDGTLGDRMLLYNVLLEDRYGGPVRSVALLLRPEANAAHLTGVLTRTGPEGEYLRFAYRVMRLWELPAVPLLTGPLGTVPLGLLTDEAKPALPALVRQVEHRFQAEADTPAQAAELLTVCDILLGLRYDKDEVSRLFEGVRSMRESSTYQAILEEGRSEGQLAERRITLREIGESRFGRATPELLEILEGIKDPGRLERMRKRLMLAADWSDLLSTP